MVLAGVLAVALVGVVGVALFSGGGPNYSCGELLQPQAGATVESPIVTPDGGRAHLSPGSRTEYAACPPASGPHYQQTGVAPLPPGFRGPQDRIAPGQWVHNLEHGYAVALYRCVDDVGPPLNRLRQFVQNGPTTPGATACGYRSKVVAARFDDMATPFALLAWNRVLLLDEFDEATALDFAETWIDVTGPEAAC